MFPLWAVLAVGKFSILICCIIGHKEKGILHGTRVPYKYCTPVGFDIG